MTAPTLLELAEHLKQLTGPCRETDAEIARHLGWTLRQLSEVWICADNDNPRLIWIMPDVPTYQYEGREYIDSGYYHHGRGGGGPPRFTASLDAAMTLLVPGWEWEVTNLYGHAQVNLPLNSRGWQRVSRADNNVVLAFVECILRARAASGISHG